MDDHDDVELPSHSSRRRVLQAGLFAHIEIRPWHWGLGNPELRS